MGILAATAIVVTGYQMNNQPYTPGAPRDSHHALAQFQAVQVEAPAGEASGQPLATPENTTPAVPQDVCPMTGKTMAASAASGTHAHCPHSGQPGQICCPK